MKLINASVGKIGSIYIGPKQFLNEAIRLGEAAICIAKDQNHIKPNIWMVGAIEKLIDYIALAQVEGEVPNEEAEVLLYLLDHASNHKPATALERLAKVLEVDEADLQDTLRLAQVEVSSPIMGVADFASGTMEYLNKGNPMRKRISSKEEKMASADIQG